jgi:hypothetical protein
MIKELFNIGSKSQPVLVQEGAVIPVQPRIRKTKSQSVNAEKVLQSLLTDLQNVNNPKVDALRMLAIALENGGDTTTLKAFCKQSMPKKKSSKK